MLGEDEAADAGANDQDGGVVHHGIIVAQGRVKAWIGWFALCGGWLFFWRHPCPGEGGRSHVMFGALFVLSDGAYDSSRKAYAGEPE